MTYTWRYFFLDKRLVKCNVSPSQIRVLNLAVEARYRQIKSYRKGQGPVQISALCLHRRLFQGSVLWSQIFWLWHLSSWWKGERSLPPPTLPSQVGKPDWCPPGHKLSLCNLQASHKSNKVVEFTTLIYSWVLSANSLKLLPRPGAFPPSFSFPLLLSLVKIQLLTFFFMPASQSLCLSIKLCHHHRCRLIAL